MSKPDTIIRSATPHDAKQIGQLIYDTIRSVNRKDYTQEQVEVWGWDPEAFSTYEDSHAYVVERAGRILAFGNMTSEGYVHRFYVHKDHQREGIGKKLLETLEAKAREISLREMTTEASVTAKPFFLTHGFLVKKQQDVIYRGLSFINFKMYKMLN